MDNFDFNIYFDQLCWRGNRASWNLPKFNLRQTSKLGMLQDGRLYDLCHHKPKYYKVEYV